MSPSNKRYLNLKSLYYCGSHFLLHNLMIKFFYRKNILEGYHNGHLPQGLVIFFNCEMFGKAGFSPVKMFCSS